MDRRLEKYPEDRNEAVRDAAVHAIADALRQRVLRAVGPAKHARVGRNEPCPCGSGRKFKKCCIGHEMHDAIAQLRDGLPPEMLPRFWQEKNPDVDRLADMLKTEPELRSVRYRRHRLRRFFAARLPQDTTEQPAEREYEILLGILTDYLAENDESEAFETFLEASAACAARRRDMDTLRCLAMGCFYATWDLSTDEPAHPSPLAMMILRATMRDSLGDLAEERVNIERLLAIGHSLKANAGGHPAPLQEIRELAMNPPGEIRDALDTLSEELSALLSSMDEGRFPVYVPFPSIARVIAHLAVHGAGNPDDAKKLRKLVTDAISEFGDEDARLYDDLLVDWLDDGEGSGEEIRLVRLTRHFLGLSDRSLIAGIAVTSTLRHIPKMTFPWEGELPKHSYKDPALYDAYAEVLAARGFPGLAERLRGCRALLG